MSNINTIYNEVAAGESVIVEAPGAFCNATLNGSKGFVIMKTKEITTVLLMTGKRAGRRWQFDPLHLRSAYRPE